MEKVKYLQKRGVVDDSFELTEEDIQALLKSEEDIRKGRVYTEEEAYEYLRKECGFVEQKI